MTTNTSKATFRVAFSTLSETIVHVAEVGVHGVKSRAILGVPNTRSEWIAAAVGTIQNLYHLDGLDPEVEELTPESGKSLPGDSTPEFRIVFTW